MIRLERCSLTVLNASNQLSAYHQDVAFFRARSAADADATPGGTPAATPLATLELTDCIARGEAVFLSVEDLQPVHVLWDNGLLVTTERFLSAGGGQAGAKTRRNVADRVAARDRGHARRALPADQHARQPLPVERPIRL